MYEFQHIYNGLVTQLQQHSGMNQVSSLRIFVNVDKTFSQLLYPVTPQTPTASVFLSLRKLW